ncbi:hypothetical protein M9980_03120 [Sphingomonas donggukensis]|uniref:Uncharacterized protein n=1 Tax=Sphingomonas donggukensis TaxID=2949093 RepID=A0ABY4TX45_9SPHN|nr:hypothetical protein [Sphingomonas donggukensis]URW76231.1 hypothetical protein M9980_03120 [Sphingomonas donggukensis]
MGTALACSLNAATALAQEAPATAVAPACDRCTLIPALTPVTLEVLAPLGSKTSKSGDTFPIRLAEAIVIDGAEAVPAGTTGMGEVVHAKASGGSGAAGELVLAARYLEVGDKRLRLRSMHLSPNGKSKIDTVNTLSVATAAVAPALSVIGFLIRGAQTTVPQGTIVEAKTAEAFTLAAAPAR